MTGIRVETDVEMLHTPGSYWKARTDAGDTIWYVHAPGPGGFHGNLAKHDVTEHEDGTITVSPSILITKHTGETWHGFLEHGEWREV